MSLVLILFVLMCLGAPLAVALGRRLERDSTQLNPASLAEIARLREDMERLSGEVQRLQEEQSFIVNLLGEAEKKKLLEGPAREG